MYSCLYLADVACSGVLGAALERSRQKWLVEGLFEKYWVKPTKKNPQDSSNPAKDSMHRLAPCTIIIEPHHFDVTLYSVKSSPQQVTFLSPQKPTFQQSSPATYGSPYGSSYQHQGPSQAQHQVLHSPGAFPSPTRYVHSNTTPSSSRDAQTSTPNPVPVSSISSAGSAASQPAPAAASTTTPAPATAPVSPALAHPPRHTQEASRIGGQRPSATSTPQPPTSTTSASQPHAPPQPSANTSNSNQENHGTDPVIQMLAARAAEDPNLKSLMKVVAQGHANQEQLSIFQRHIDELNTIINERKKQLANAGSSIPQQQNPPAPSYSPKPRPSVPAPVMTPAAPPRPLHPAMPPLKHESPVPYYSPHPVIKAKGPVPPKQDISAIVFEYIGVPHTRYLLPKHSIVEHISGSNNGQVLVSFLIIRKGSAEFGGKYRADKEYYQPVTMKLQSSMPKFMENITKAVEPAEEVRKHMIGIMDKIDIAENVYLATRLLRVDGEESKAKDSRSSDLLGDTDIPQDHYSGPNSILPLRST